MKKYIQGKIEELKYLYPNEKITVQNGFLGIANGDRLKHNTYLGNEYFEIDGVIYTDYNTKNKAHKLITI